MKILINQDIDRYSWSSFNNNYSLGNIFQSPEFFDLLQSNSSNKPQAITVKDDTGDIIGLLISVILKERSGLIGFFTSRSIITGGPIAKNNDQKVISYLLKEYHDRVNNKAIFSQFRNIHKVSTYSGQFEKLGFKYEPHLNVLIDLLKSKDQLWEELHKERKRNIRISLKKGVQIREITQGNEIEPAIGLLIETYKKARLPLAPVQFFRNIRKYLGDQAKFFGGYDNDRLIAVRILLCFKDRVNDWYAAMDHQHRDKYPNDLLLWHIFLWAKESGFTVFDFGGAGKPGIPYGVRDYKSKFGGQMVEFGRFEKIHKPLLMKLGKIGIKFYKLF